MQTLTIDNSLYYGKGKIISDNCTHSRAIPNNKLVYGDFLYKNPKVKKIKQSPVFWLTMVLVICINILRFIYFYASLNFLEEL